VTERASGGLLARARYNPRWTMLPPPSHPTTPTPLIWHALEPAAARHVMSAVDVPWWIAGGWAIDLFVGAQTRAHKDLDIGLPRVEAPRVVAALPGWEFFEAKDRSLSRLAPGTSPRGAVNCLWGRRVGEPHWELELILDESDGKDWIFRRDPSIRRPFAAALRATSDGTRYLAPEIQLLYKARDLRPEDRSDFEHAAPRLESVAAGWLRDCLSRLYPQHPWLPALAQNPSRPE
jgi:Aminoglycoside-2''-adenylyltransferase